MSEAAKAKLRDQAEQNRIDAIDALRFTTALTQVKVTPENLRKLIARCNTNASPGALHEMSASLQSWIEAEYRLGHEIDSVTLINFFAESDLPKHSKRREPQAVVRLCKAGSKCLRAVRRKAAPVPGSGQFCSPACAASERARQKRALEACPETPVN